MFNNNGIVFNEVRVIDDSVTKEQALQYVSEADVKWLAGGDAFKQISYIKEYDLISALQNRDGLTIGMSAGSINMAKRVVLAKDRNDYNPELAIYEGIGLVDINVEPHLDSASEEHIKHIYEASQYATIYGLYDNSFIKVVDDKIEFYGAYFKYENIVK